MTGTPFARSCVVIASVEDELESVSEMGGELALRLQFKMDQRALMDSALNNL